MSVQSGGMPEQARVLNFLNMFKDGSMGDPSAPGTTMRGLPLMCKTVLAIRKLNRKMLDQLHSRSWKSFDDVRPYLGDEILTRFEDRSGVHVELMEWTEEDIEFFDTDSEDVRWMKLPPIE